MLKINNELSRLFDKLGPTFDEPSHRHTRMEDKARQLKAREADASQVDDAMEKLHEVRENTMKTTFRMWDRHNDMVKKSQELHKMRSRQMAIARRNRQRREDQTDLLAKMALENARRSKMIQLRSIERQDRERAAQAV